MSSHGFVPKDTTREQRSAGSDLFKTPPDLCRPSYLLPFGQHIQDCLQWGAAAAGGRGELEKCLIEAGLLVVVVVVVVILFMVQGCHQLLDILVAISIS